MHKQTIPLTGSVHKCDCSVECFEDNETNCFNGLRPALKKEHSINLTLDRCVHFADAHGLELVHVCRFKDSSESVNKLDSENIHNLSLVYNSNSCLFQPTTTSENTNILTCPWIICFNDHKFDENINYLVKNSGVKLKYLQINYSKVVSNWICDGIINVYNYKFHKRVIIRLTKNDWNSFEDYSCSWLSHDSQQNIDSFKLSFELPSNKSFNEHRIEFCIKFMYSKKEIIDNISVDSKHYDDQIIILWDNNNGCNYKIVR